MQVFVGRAGELAALHAALERAQDGHGGWVLLTGEAGLGKTRLVDSALSAAPAAGRTTVWSAARETEQSVPYRVWRPVLRMLGQDDVLSRLRGTDGAGAADRADLHDEVADVLVAAGRSRPLVVVLEDLHWADADSVALLDTAAPSLRASRVLLLATSRTTVGTAGAALRPDVHLPLAPLSEAEVEQLADALDAPAELRAGLHARTGGNPLHVRELLQAAGTGAVPATLAAGVAARLAAAGREAATVAEAAAVLGEEVPLDQLLAVAGLGPEQTAGLARLVDARLLVPVPGAALHYRFPHALLREAVLAQLLPDRRAVLSAAAARVLGSAAAAPGVVAAHVVTAAAGGALPPAAAGAALRSAAEEAERLCAWEQAVALRAQAVAWAREAGESARAVLAHADALARAGAAAQARERHLEAAALARRAGDPVPLALAALGLSGGLGGVEVPMRDSEQVALLDEALAALPAGGLRAHVRARRSVAVTYLEAEDDRAREAGLALTEAEAADDHRAAVAALSALADARSGPDHVSERLRVGAEMVRRGARARSPEHEMLGLRVRLLAELERGDVPAAATSTAAHGRLAERLGQARYRWYAPLWRGSLALMRGDVAAAWTANAEATALGARAGSGNAVVLTLSQRVVILMATRDAPALQALLAPVLVEYPDMVGPRTAATWAQVVQGERAAAGPALERLVRVDLPELPVDSEWLPTVGLLADAVVRQGAAHLAGPLLEALRPYRSLFLVDGIVDGVFGSAGRFVGALAALAGDWVLADDAFQEALHAEELAGAALPAAETRGLWGRALVDTGRDAARGSQLLRTAQAWRAAAGLGAPGAQTELPDVVRLTRGDDGWEYSRGERRAELPRTRGLELLVALLQKPDEELRAVDLDGRDVQEDDLGPGLDAVAERAYRRRVAELGELLEAARADGDADGAARLRRERDQLEHALGAALGLGGRVRPQGSSAERARTAVTKALRDAVRRIGDVDPLVGEHLAASVRTGSWCSYRPDPATRVRWRLSTQVAALGSTSPCRGVTAPSGRPAP